MYCAALVEHLFPQVYDDLIKEIHRILKKNGKLVIYAPNPEHLFEILKKHNIILKKDVTHVDYKTMKRLKKTLQQQGFFIKKAFFIESHIPLFNIIEKMFMKFLPVFRRRIGILAIKR